MAGAFIAAAVAVLDGDAARNTFLQGASAVVVATFTDSAGAPAAPSDPWILLRAPDGSTARYDAAALTSPSTGVYELLQPLSEAGVWSAFAGCTSPLQAVAEIQFEAVTAVGVPVINMPSAGLLTQNGQAVISQSGQYVVAQ